MSPGARLAIAAAGVVAVILAFVALRPAENADGPATTTTTPTAATGPSPGDGGAASTPTGPATATPAPKPAGPKAFIVQVRGGRPVGGVRELEARAGEPIRITVTADRPDEVHLHGYDVERPGGPGRPAVFDVTTDLEGIFELELHDSAVQIADLRVSPR